MVTTTRRDSLVGEWWLIQPVSPRLNHGALAERVGLVLAGFLPSTAVDKGRVVMACVESSPMADEERAQDLDDLKFVAGWKKVTWRKGVLPLADPDFALVPELEGITPTSYGPYLHSSELPAWPVQREMRALVNTLYSRGESRRQVFVDHACAAGERVKQVVSLGGECADASLAEDWHLAAIGRDLYMDTKVSREDVRLRFGDRVDRMIEGMTNRSVGREAYDQSVAAFAEELCVIRLAGVIDAIATSTARLRHLDAGWVGGTFVPLMKNGVSTWTGARHTRYPKTAALLHHQLAQAHEELIAALKVESLRDQTGDPGASGNRTPLTSADILLRSEERDLREGWLMRGTRAFLTLA